MLARVMRFYPGVTPDVWDGMAMRRRKVLVDVMETTVNHGR
jgi:hypothetical protein